jgi:FAD/FMN-containing dehydrogenase
VNARLAPFGARIGPDPASINACTMGGILANNSSGMCCGVAENAYHTLESLTFVLPSGTVIDTSMYDAGRRLRTAERVRREFLAQSAYSDDAFSAPEQTCGRIRGILADYHAAAAAAGG